MTITALEEAGVAELRQGLQHEWLTKTDYPMRNQKKAKPKGGGKSTIPGDPTIRGRVEQGALTLILEPIFDSDLQVIGV